MTPADFFNAYIDEIQKIHKTINEGEPMSDWYVRHTYYTDLWDMIERIFEKAKEEKASNDKIERIEKVLVKMSNQGQFPKIGNSTRRGRRHVYVADKKSNPLSFKM